MVDLGTVASPTLIMMRTTARARLGDRADAAFGNAVESVRRLHAAGVVVVAGTDANETPMDPVAHGASLHEELALLREAGLTPVDASGPRPRAPPEPSSWPPGAVSRRAPRRPGAVDADPTTDSAVLRQPAAVWVAGVPPDTRRPRAGT